MTGTVYINATGTLGGDGSGSGPANPIDCSTQVKYDAFIAGNCDQGSDTPVTSLTIIYSAGTFQTNGGRASTSPRTAFSGNVHQGAGIDITILKLVNCTRRTEDGIVFACTGHHIHNWSVFDMTLDCNPTGNPKSADCFDPGSSPAGAATGFITTVDRGTWASGTAYVQYNKVLGSNGQSFICQASNTAVDPTTESPHVKWGLNGRGSLTCINLGDGVNITVQRIKCIGFGTFLLGFENFPIYIGGTAQSSQQQCTNILIDSCVFANPAANNKDGCTIVAMVNNTLETMDATCRISNCSYINCWSATAGQPGDFSYSHCASGPNIINNNATNCDTFVYYEPNGIVLPGLIINITGNTVTNCTQFLSVSADTSGSQSTLAPIVANNNICSFGDMAATSSAITYNQSASGTPALFGPLTVCGNTFRSGTLLEGSQFWRFGIRATNGGFASITSVISYNNRWINYVPSQIYTLDAGVLSSSVGQGDQSVYMVQSAYGRTVAGSVTTQAAVLGSTTAGNTLICVINNYQTPTATTVTGVAIGGGSATFSKVVSNSDGATRNSEIWYAYNISFGSGSPTVTATFSGLTVNCELQVYEMFGLDPGGLIEGFNLYSNTSGTAASSGPIVTYRPMDFIVAASYGTASASAAGTGWMGGITTNNGIAEYLFTMSQGTYSAAATYPAATSYTIVAAAFASKYPGPSYPSTLDLSIGQGSPGSTLSIGGMGGQSHIKSHDDISVVIAALERNAVASDTFLIQEHFDTSTVAATLVTAVPQGAFDVIPTFTGTGCTIVRAASVAGHKGIWTLTTGTVASQKPEVSQLPTLKDIQTGFFGKLAFRAVVLTPATLPSGSTTANAVWRIGFTDTLGSLAPVNCIEWVFNPATNAFWSLVLINASTATTTASTVTVAINTWYDLQIYVDSLGVQARAGVYAVSALPTLLAGGPFTTHQPATTTNMCWHVLAMNGASGTTSFGINLDLIEMAGQPTISGICSNWRGASMLKGF